MSELQDNINNLSPVVEAALLILAKQNAINLQNKMRKNAKWTDRTGHARQRLTGTSYRDKNDIVIKLAHGVDYGVYLELANEKKFAIIQPTINSESAQVVKSFENLFDKIKK